MVSDVLSEAIQGLDRYLKDEPPYNEAYTGELRRRIVKLRNDMDALRVELDSPMASSSEDGDDN
jgi:hypothetical protein